MSITERVPQVPPKIAPIPEGVPRPLWSVMIPVYNSLPYLEETIRSILAQDPGEDLMQIEVVDDISKDGDVAALVERVGKGRVQFYQQPVNVGNVRNFETCINRARGHYVHLLHGDDYVETGYYTAIEKLFEDFPEAGAACTDWHYVTNDGNKLWNNEMIDTERGILKNWLQRISVRQYLEPPAMVVKRSTYEDLGAFYGVQCAEDWVMWVRIASKYPVAYTPEVLAKYRVHPQNITSASFKNGNNFRDLMKAIQMNMLYLPVGDRKKAEKASRKNFAYYFAHLAHNKYHQNGDTEMAKIIAHDALRFQWSAMAIKKALLLYFKILIRYKQ
ncbi:MAG: hypothetical protein RLY89_2074 [Bacteroidota bacterium]|jgi:glycosyltransferase involved in cell wall biosynthesis